MKRISAQIITLSAFSALSAQDKPNIIVFLVDDMGVMDTSVPFITDANKLDLWSKEFFIDISKNLADK